MARALVTGAGGFIGRALVRALRACGHEVTALTHADGDVTETATWANVPAADHVFHLAARTYVPDSWNEPADFFRINVTGTQRALDYCRAHGSHLVFVSGYIYGVPQRLPIREDDPVAPNNPYAQSKAAAERACAAHAASTSLPVTVFRPFNVFGPGQRADFLIPTIVRQVRAGRTIHVQDLTPRRDFVFIDDVVEALMRGMEEPKGYRVFNIGFGVSYSVRELVDAIQAAAGTALPVASEGTPRPNEIPDVRADIARAREQLGWAPRHTLAQGIARLLVTE
jgi:GDP-4-dehydro-6-deoxy-D-mannose reductase